MFVVLKGLWLMLEVKKRLWLRKGAFGNFFPFQAAEEVKKCRLVVSHF
jgi:hypothetical protein